MRKLSSNFLVKLFLQVYFVPGTPNNLAIRWHYDPDNKFQAAIYCLGVFLVKRLTPHDLIAQLQKRPKSDEVSKVSSTSDFRSSCVFF